MDPDNQNSKTDKSVDAPVNLEDFTDRILGDFRLLRRLGSGGMAHVFLAEQISLKRNVAIKLLREEMLDDSDDVLLKRFEQEAKSAAVLNHKNIVQVYAIGEEEGVHFIAQEYVPGMNLREYLTRKGPPDVSVAIHIMRQVANALHVAAESGVVHRDIKPENIMITRKGEVKVADFGLAQLTRGEERVNLTQVGTTMGTPLYMSPEQVNGKPLDARSDIYSFGVTCYHLLSGKPPFQGETALSIAVKHLNETPIPLEERRTDLPQVLCQLINKMMEKKPDNRYESAMAVGKDLRTIAKTLKQDPDAVDDLSLTAVTAIQHQKERKPFAAKFFSWSFNQHVLLFFLMALIIGGASAAAGWLSRPGDPFERPARQKTRSSKQNLKENARDQYSDALMQVKNEEAWLAVIENFPQDKMYKRRAQEQLALLYLIRKEFDKALSLYEELSNQQDGEEFQATGIAGEAIIAALQGDHQTSQQLIAENQSLLSKHLNAVMKQYTLETIRRNQVQLNGEVKRELEELFKSEPPPVDDLNLE